MNYQAILGWGAVILVLWFVMRRGGCCGGLNQKGVDGMNTGDTAVDPICGMTVQKGTALHQRVDGVDYYFCSQACLNEFMRRHGDDGTHGTPGHGTHAGHCC